MVDLLSYGYLGVLTFSFLINLIPFTSPFNLISIASTVVVAYVLIKFDLILNSKMFKEDN